MQSISDLRSCVNRLISLSLILHEVHFPQCRKYLVYCIFIVQFTLQIPVYNKCNKAGYEVPHDPVLTVQIYRTCLEVRLHDSETFLNLPATLVCVYYSPNAVIEICAHCIETIIFFFVFNDGLVYVMTAQ